MTMTKMLALVFSVAFNDPVLSASKGTHRCTQMAELLQPQASDLRSHFRSHKGQWRRVFASRDWPLDVSTEAALNAEAASAQLVAEHPRTLRAVVTPGNPRDLTFVVSEDSEVKQSCITYAAAVAILITRIFASKSTYTSYKHVFLDGALSRQSGLVKGHTRLKIDRALPWATGTCMGYLALARYCQQARNCVACSTLSSVQQLHETKQI